MWLSGFIVVVIMKYDSDIFSGGNESEFNMEFSYFNRLNYLWYNCNTAAINLDIYGWYHTLSALYRELSAEMKDEDKEKWGNELISMNQLISNHLSFANRGVNRIAPELYIRLHNFELYLRNVLKEAGLQHKKKLGAGQALTQ
jgi:hypothetical protein